MLTRVSLDGPADCVSRSQLLAGVAARSERIRVVETSEAAFAVEVVVRRVGDRVEATLALSRPSGQRAAPRRLSTSTCDDARDALALVLAIGLDPASATEPSKPATPSRSRSQRAPPAPTRADLSIGGLLIGVLGPAPEATLGGGAFVHARFRVVPTWPAAFRLGGAYASRSGVTVAGARADFAQVLAVLQVCPWAPDTGRFQLAACASLGLSRLSARGHDVPNARDAAAWGGDAGAGLLLGWGLTESLRLELPLGATVPFARRSYQFAPHVFYEAAPITWGAGFGAAWRFR